MIPSQVPHETSETHKLDDLTIPKFVPRIARLVLASSKRPGSDGEDLVQEVCLRLLQWTRRRDAEVFVTLTSSPTASVYNLDGLVLSILKAVLTDEHRRKMAQKRTVVTVSLGPQGDLDDVADRGPSPPKKLEEKVHLEYLEVLLSHLDASERDLIEDVHIRELSFAEIALKHPTGTKVGTLRQRASRIIARLRERGNPGFE